MTRARAVSFFSGALFGVGLAMSGMLDRERILGFLDVAGAWDPTLLWVMAGAAGTTLISFRFVFRRWPFLRQQFATADQAGITKSLVLGAALFGVGWGVSGYCPGPGVALLAVEWRTAVLYLVGVIAGSLLAHTFAATSSAATPITCG